MESRVPSGRRTARSSNTEYKNTDIWKPPVSRKSPNRFRRTSPKSSRRRGPSSGGSLVTVTAVRVSPDFSYAKIYVSVFPFGAEPQSCSARQHNWFMRRALGQRIRNQLKNVPEIQFFPRRFAGIHRAYRPGAQND